MAIATHLVSKAQYIKVQYRKTHLKITTLYSLKLTENNLVLTVPTSINRPTYPPNRSKPAKSLVDKKNRMSCKYL